MKLLIKLLMASHVLETMKKLLLAPAHAEQNFCEFLTVFRFLRVHQVQNHFQRSSKE